MKINLVQEKFNYCISKAGLAFAGLSRFLFLLIVPVFAAGRD
jgi:hypothetical protein